MPLHAKTWSYTQFLRLSTYGIFGVTYTESTLVQTLIRKITELTNENHQHDCRFSELAPCPRYIEHTEADRPAENAVVATGSCSYAVPVANLYIHLDSWLKNAQERYPQWARSSTKTGFIACSYACVYRLTCKSDVKTSDNPKQKTEDNREQENNSSKSHTCFSIILWLIY